MSTEQTTDQVVETAEETQERAQIVPRKVFIRTVMAGAAAGKTNQEVCDELGMNRKSFDSRLSTERNKLKKKGVKLPQLKTERGTRAGAASDDEMAELVRSMMADLEGQNEVEDDDDSDDDGEMSLEDSEETETANS